MTTSDPHWNPTCGHPQMSYDCGTCIDHEAELTIKAFAAKQKPMPPEFSRALNKKLFQLVGGDNPETPSESPGSTPLTDAFYEARVFASASQVPTPRQFAESLELRCRSLEAALKGVLASAVPNKRDHPAMWEAWQKGQEALAQGSGGGEG